MRTAEFDYVLPPALIANHPLRDRSASRLLVLQRSGSIEHRNFFHIPAYLKRGDVLIINNTKVFPARLTGTREDGQTMDILLVRELSPGTWEVLSRGSYTGRLTIAGKVEVDLEGGTRARFRHEEDLMPLIWSLGDMPLPPYIRRPPSRDDKETYQTVYASREGSIAAPTAGLHFTRELLREIAERGVIIREVTLHVGVGTFRPVRSEAIEDHSMEREYFQIPTAVIDDIRDAKAKGNRIVAVGTTTTRAIEGYFSGSSTACPETSPASDPRVPPLREDDESRAPEGSGWISGATDIFIRPGYAFQAVDSLITNFPLPRSTPLMLVCALAGREKILSAYREAIDYGYRFLSYGDAMLIL